MKIGSSFDTAFKKKQIEKYISIYGKDFVIVITRTKRYLIFYFILPLTITLLSSLFLIYAGIISNEEIIKWILLLAGCGIIAYGLYSSLEDLITYSMGFCIVTPSEVLTYKQIGLLKRKSKFISTKDVKVVTVDNSGLLQSILNYGDIVILTEGIYNPGDAEGSNSQIRIRYNHDAEGIKTKIEQLLHMRNIYEGERKSGEEVRNLVETHKHNSNSIKS